MSEWLVFLYESGAGDFTLANDIDGRASKAFNVQALGTTIIIDQDGREVYRDETTSTYEMLRAGIRLAQSE